MSDAGAIRQPTPSSLARRDELTIEDMLAQVQKVQQVMAKVMKEGEHYGVIPGTSSKPSLLKPGAEKLCMLFRLDPQYAARETVDGKHLTIESTCTLYHIPTGERWGSGMGSCSTKESKYAYRQGKRLCPKCDKDTIIKGKAEYGGGWLCFAKKGGCGAKWPNGAVEIEGQSTERVANEDLADQYNTVLKMANKRALVAAVLNVTAASDIFTQDLEDLPRDEPRPLDVTPGASPASPTPTGSPTTDEATTLFPKPEDEERNTLVAEAQRLAKVLGLTPKYREAFKVEYLGGADVFDCDLSALATMVAELRKREPRSA